MSDNVSIEGLDKSSVLAALYNASKPQGLGFLHFDPTPMTPEDAAKHIKDGGRLHFDYFQGRVMKVDLGGDSFDPWLYDRDNGEGAAQRAIDELRGGHGVNSEVIERNHLENTRNAAIDVQDRLSIRSHAKPAGDGRIAEFEIGIDSPINNLLAAKLRGVLDDHDTEE